MDSQWHPVVQCPRTADDDCHLGKELRDAAQFQHLLQILQVNLEDYIPKWQIFVEQDNDFPKISSNGVSRPLCGLDNQ